MRNLHWLKGERGFSVLEMVIATGMMMAVTAAVFTLMNPAQGSFQTEPEVADVQQRLRIAEDTLAKDLVMAGAGPYGGTLPAGQLDRNGTEKASTTVSVTPGPLLYYFAPILPFRQGAVGDAGSGTYRTDTLTLFYVPSTTAQTTTSSVLNSSANPVQLQVYQETDCALGINLCGFIAPMTVLIFDDTGNYDTFRLTDVSGNAQNATGTLVLNRPPDSVGTTYPIGAKVVQAIQRTYYLKSDPVNKVYQLVYYDGSTNADVPVVDHLVSLKFDYYGDPQPPVLKKPLSDPTGPWTSYGPKPPALGVQQGTFPAGENCTFTKDPQSGQQIPRLANLGAPANPNSLVQLTQAQLTDGPWCPDASNANRWDADLLRIRKVGVTMRVEAAVDALRGPASYLFTNGGTSKGGTKWVPDQEIRFEISPRNMNLGR